MLEEDHAAPDPAPPAGKALTPEQRAERARRGGLAAAEALTPEQRAARARIGGHATAARHDPHEYTQPARAGFLKKFEDEVDPDRQLPEPERRRRAEAALKLHMARLAWKSAQARRKRAR